MKAVVDEALGDVAGFDAPGRLEFVAEDHLVHGGRPVGQIVHPVQLLADVIGVEHCVFSGLPQPVRSVGQDVGQCADKHAHVAVKGANPAHGFGTVVVPVFRAVLALDQHRDGQKRLQKRFAGHRAGAGTAAAVRRGEGLVEVQVHHVHAEVAGPRFAHQCVHVGAVHVEQRAFGVENFGDPCDLALEDANGRGIGQHQRSGLRVHLRRQGFQIDAAFDIGLEVLDRVAADGRCCRIRPMSGVGNEDFAARIALRLVPCANEQDAGKFAVCTGGRL